MGELSTVLRERGFRLTLQRELILDAVEARHGHISADDLYAEIHRRFPQVNISTVYRTLELLEEEGLLSHTHFHDGISRWHREAESHHQHLICERCGWEGELALELVEPLSAELQRRYGFVTHPIHFAIVGLCRNCAAAAFD